MNKSCLACVVALLLPCCAQAVPPLRVVAAENFYGDIARQIGGNDVAVTSILASPDQDPHLFEVGPSVARAVSDAGLIIENGIDYDPWMDRLIEAARVPANRVVVVAALTGHHSGDNPHIWYDPATMPALARALQAIFAAADPAHAAGYAQRLARFEATMTPLRDRIAGLRQKLQGAPVTATEPVFGYMLAALGVQSLNQRFQLAVMNETEASASDVAAFEDDLRHHRVRMLIVNRQASNAVADRMKSIALGAGVPVVATSESEPRGSAYQPWMLSELDAVDKVVTVSKP